MNRRVVVTGTGVVSPVGTGVAAMWEALAAGRSGVAPVTLFDASSLPVRIAAEVDGFDGASVFGTKRARHLDRFAQLALVATTEALGASGLDVARCPERVGVVYASGLGGIGTLEHQMRVLSERGPSRVSPFMWPMAIPNMAAGEIAMEFGITGPNSCTVTACAASAHAVAAGADLIRLGRTDAVVCGGADAAVTPLTLAGFASMGALSRRNDDPASASRPFDSARDGFVCGEGAATLVLEEAEAARRRGAAVLGELVGCGLTSDAHHKTAPHPEGDGAARAMRAALGEAGLSPDDVGYVNAHGTGTPLNDRVEALATTKVLGRGVAVSSTKSMTGHLLGAAGALEAAISLQALVTGLVPPTVNQVEPDPDCGLDYVPNQARRLAVDVVMSNSFGFGGHNASLVFRR